MPVYGCAAVLASHPEFSVLVPPVSLPQSQEDFRNLVAALRGRRSQLASCSPITPVPLTAQASVTPPVPHPQGPAVSWMAPTPSAVP